MRRLLGAPLAFAARLGGRGLALLLAIVLARILGVHDYGIYAYATAWATVLMIPSALGFEQILLRQIALYRSRDRPDLIRGIIRRAHRIVLPFVTLLTLAAAIVAFFVVDQIFIVAVLVALPAVIFRALGRLWSGVLQGLGWPELSFTPIFIVFPLTMLAAVGALLLFGVELTAVSSVVIYTGAMGVSLLFAFLIARHLLRPVVAGAPVGAADVDTRRLLGPFTAVALVSALSTQIGLLMLGAFDEADSVGVFQVATRLAEPASMLLMAITISIAPKIAAGFDQGDLEGLRATIARAARTCFLLSIPIVAILIIARTWLLGIFGEGFTVGGTALIIVALAQLFNAFTGPVNIALTMTAHVWTVVKVAGAALIVNVAICLLLIPSMGATGAAIAMAADILVSQTVLAVIAWRRLGVNTTALPLPTPPRPAWVSEDGTSAKEPADGPADISD